MKKRNYHLLSDLENALYREDHSSLEPNADPTGGESSNASATEADFIMISGSPICPGCQVNYTELVLDGSGSSTTKPINEEDEPESVILLMDLPKPIDTWTMRLNLSSPELDDNVGLTTIEGIYTEVYDVKVATEELVFEKPGVYFTVKIKKNQYETYLNINQPERMMMLTHSKEQTFDYFRVSFLALTGA